jgi:glyoxylase-like metal-dependent hydrolase (beta-lactamase superfamily II)
VFTDRLGQRFEAVSMAVLVLAVLMGMDTACFAQNPTRAQTPGCEGLEARGCLDLATAAMGGREKLAAIKTEQLDVIGHTELMEQSYRQAPFITSYARETVTVDLAGQRLIKKEHSVWPEADLKQADADFTLIVTPAGGVVRRGEQDGPCGAANMDAAREALALGPESVLLTAAAAHDLHYADSETLRSTEHTALAFTWNGVPVRVLVNRFNHLPDAVETTEEFRDFWFYWGDVQQRVYFDNWRWVGGVEYPSNQVTERNGAVWSSTQALDIAFNAPVDEKDFAMDAKVGAMSAGMQGLKAVPFSPGQDKALAEGIDLYLGAWNTTIVKQADGVVILETPIAEKFTKGILAEAKKRYPDAPVKAVLSTSDSWPHVGGVRFDAAQGLPVYILDLNEPLLERMVTAPHTIDPDAEETAKKAPQWKIVTKRTEIGTGANRIVVVPLRGASTERQYMVYFPERKLLYASDTLVVNDDHTIYDPELTHEVVQAVEREHLVVETVYAMHQAPVPWSEVVEMMGKAS